MGRRKPRVFAAWWLALPRASTNCCASMAPALVWTAAMRRAWCTKPSTRVPSTKRTPRAASSRCSPWHTARQSAAHALGGDGCLLAAPGALQFHLLLRGGEARRGAVQHELASVGEIAVQLLGLQHGFKTLAAEGGQGQQVVGAALGRAPGGGPPALQAPAPLVHVPLRAHLERRAGRQQQFGHRVPEAAIGQGLHVAGAQLRAIAAAGASPGLSLVGHGRLHAALVELIGGGQAHDARAKDTYLHLVCSTLLTESQCRVRAGL